MPRIPHTTGDLTRPSGFNIDVPELQGEEYKYSVYTLHTQNPHTHDALNIHLLCQEVGYWEVVYYLRMVLAPC